MILIHLSVPAPILALGRGLFWALAAVRLYTKVKTTKVVQAAGRVDKKVNPQGEGYRVIGDGSVRRAVGIGTDTGSTRYFI